MAERNNPPLPFWNTVDSLVKEGTVSSLTLAVLEADKICVYIAKQKYHHLSSEQERLDRFSKDLSRPEEFIKMHEICLGLRNTPGFFIGDLYRMKDMIEGYEMIIKESLFGDIEERHFSSFHYRLWFFYSYIKNHKRVIKKISLQVIVVILIMLFIADTQIGANIFSFLIDKIHYILKLLAVLLLALFLISFVVISVISGIDSKGKKKK